MSFTKRRPLMERFWEKVDKDGQVPTTRPDLGKCWQWTGALNGPNGYGRIGAPGGSSSGIGPLSAHRISYEFHVAKIPGNCEIDHLCVNRACVNPSHLEPVSHQINMQRSDVGKVNRAKTHCPYGHEYSIENTYLIPSGGRRCRTCKRASYV